MGFARSLIFRASLLFVALAPWANAQWTNLPSDGVPRTADGKINMKAPAPRLPDGTPDLRGIWNPQNTKYLNNLAADYKPGELPILPAAEALVKMRSDYSHGAEESDAHCLPPGVPKIDTAPNPFKILQEPKLIVILYETFGLRRQFFMDGRELRKDANPTWLGYSTAKWARGADGNKESDTLVVDTTGFNGKSWLDKVGHPTSESTHITERFRRVDFGHLESLVTIEDPTAYSKPWNVTLHFEYYPNTEIIEDVCENEADVKHMPR
jgi:hypothetical protein